MKKWLFITIGILIIFLIYFLVVKDSIIKEDNLAISKIIESGDYETAIEILERYNDQDEYYNIAKRKLDSVKILKKEVDKIETLVLFHSLSEYIDRKNDFSDYYKKGWTLEVLRGIDQRAGILLNTKELKIPNLKDSISHLEGKIISLQLIEFPKLRKVFADYYDSRFASDNIKVTSVGEKSRTIIFTSDVFAKKDSIIVFHDFYLKNLIIHRFQNVIYKWGSLEESQIEYRLHSENDSTVRTYEQYSYGPAGW